MTDQILPFVCQEFFVVIEMTSHFFSLQQLDKCLLDIRDTLKSLEQHLNKCLVSLLMII